MICIYFVLIWTLSLCNLCNIGLENKVSIRNWRSRVTTLFLSSRYSAFPTQRKQLSHSYVKHQHWQSRLLMRHRRKYSESHGPVTMSFFKIVNEKKISGLASLFFPFLKSVQINFIFVDNIGIVFPQIYHLYHCNMYCICFKI